MQRYFASLNNQGVMLSDGDKHHLLHVMRAKAGQEIKTVIDGKLYGCQIDNLDPLKISIKCEYPSNAELNEKVTLFFALAKGDKIDFVIQKATELGVSRVVLVNTERSVVKIDSKDWSHKLNRYEKIAKEASEQSHRLIIPEIIGNVDINQIDKWLCEVNLFAYEKALSLTKCFYPSIEKNKSISVFIGPEGGFSEKEASLLTEHYQFKPISLGKRILRTETAAVFALSVISSHLEDI